jgi:ABC-type multidrug transport system ATPase subunit
MSRLHVDSVVKSFGARQVLTDIFLSCQTGEILGLLGRNGSGKSTLLKIIFGSLQADSKYVRVDHTLVRHLSDNMNLIRYLPQTNFLPGRIKVEKIISLFCCGKDKEHILNHEYILPLLGKRPVELSGGEQRILEILLIAHSDAKFILIDEPFNGVAPVYKEGIKNIVREQAKTKGFIITDHDYLNILDVATRLILMYDGGTKKIENLEDLKKWGYLNPFF